jgi:hypothetical protein
MPEFRSEISTTMRKSVKPEGFCGYRGALKKIFRLNPRDIAPHPLLAAKKPISHRLL